MEYVHNSFHGSLYSRCFCMHSVLCGLQLRAAHVHYLYSVHGAKCMLLSMDVET